MGVMARGGDMHGWKSLTVGTEARWYCGKIACQEMMQRVALAPPPTPGPAPWQLLATMTPGERSAERARLMARIADLDAYDEARRPATEAAQGAPEVGRLHYLGDDGVALCGAAEGRAVPPGELPEGAAPCLDCIEALEAGGPVPVQEAVPAHEAVPGTTEPSPDAPVVRAFPSQTIPGREYEVRGADGVYRCTCPSFTYSKTKPQSCKHTAIVCRNPPPEQEKAEIVFSSTLIDEINRDGYQGQRIVITPESYPSLDLSAFLPEQLRRAVGDFFRAGGMEVDAIERATNLDGGFRGIRFTLRKHG